MWFPNFSNSRKCCSSNSFLLIYLLWVLTFSHFFVHSSGFFFPLFGNFFNKARGNDNQPNNGGGVSVFSNSFGGNSTFIKVPMLRSIPEKRVDVVTTTYGKLEEEPQIQIQNNVNSTAAAEALLSHGQLIVPTSTSMTSSISTSHSQHSQVFAKPSHLHSPSTLTLPFTPNLFGMMSYVQALKDIKRNYKISEKERKIEFLKKEGKDGDLMTRILRTLIKKVVNKYQKGTEILKLKIQKRQEKLQKFLQLPMVSQVIASDQEETISDKPITLGKDGLGLSGLTPFAGIENHHVQIQDHGPSLVDSFLI